MSEDARISTALPEHPKLKKLMKRFGHDGPAAAWGLICLILWTRANRPDGDLSRLSDEDIEVAINWNGENTAFVRLLKEVGFLDGDEMERRIHDWETHNPYAFGQNDRSENSKWAALVRHYGIDGAAQRMPSYYESHQKQCTRNAERIKNDADRIANQQNRTENGCPVSGSGSVSDTISGSVTPPSGATGGVVGLAAARAWAENFSKGNSWGLVVDDAWVIEWFDDRTKIGWLTIRGGVELPIRDWQADLRDFSRMKLRYRLTSPLPGNAEKKEGGAPKPLKEPPWPWRKVALLLPEPLHIRDDQRWHPDDVSLQVRSAICALYKTLTPEQRAALSTEKGGAT